VLLTADVWRWLLLLLSLLLSGRLWPDAGLSGTRGTALLLPAAPVSACGAEDGGEGVHGGRDEGVVGPDAALVAGEDPGVDEDFEVVGNGGLGQAEGFGEVADAGFAVFMGADHRDQSEPRRVGQGFEQPGELVGLAGGDRLAQQRGAAFVGQRECGPVLDVDGSGGHFTSMRQTLTSVYLRGRVGIDSHLCPGVIGMNDQTDIGVREEVRARYAEAARAVLAPSSGLTILSSDSAADSCCGPGASCRAHGSAEMAPVAFENLYREGETDGLPEEAVLASMGCGNPLAVADLHEGERVLDLGSGGGIDVLLSARRVGPSGFAYGVDMTDEMLTLARGNAAQAGAANVEFLKGEIEAVPLPGQAVDVVISNCVINLSTDKPAVLAEMYRVLVPGGRIGISDVVADDHMSPADRAAAGSYVGCIAGALSRAEYLDGLTAAGFTNASVTFTNEAAPGLHSAIIRAVKPAG
jgi:arsenite methyltransferase